VWHVAISALVGVVLFTHGVAAQPLGLPIEGHLKSIQDTGTLRIAYRADSRPFSFVESGGQRPTGYTIELCERIAASLRDELGLKTLEIEWVRVDTQTRFPTIMQHRADMECGSTTVSLSRLKNVDFSNFIYVESTGVLVRPDRNIFSLNDLAGKRVGVVPGSTNAQALRSHLDQRKLAATLVDFNDRDEGVAALARGELDGFASDKLVLLAIAQAANHRGLVLLPDDLSFEPFAIMLPRGDWAFRLAVNAALARIFRSGEIVDLYTRYFSALGRDPSRWLGAVYTFGGLNE
jgi:glutamate/aspartate transport system substrate-binding protein